MTLPRAPATLPDDFAAALGHAVAGFGFLEEALKRGIHALSFDNLGETPDEAELQAWIGRMTHVAGDSLGALIDNFAAAMSRAKADGRQKLTIELRAVRGWRNMLCHASWAPTGDGGWRPGFISNHDMKVPQRLDAPQIEAVRERALAAARQVIAVARATGHDNWTSDPQAPLREVERARAEARAAAQAAERRPPDSAANPQPQEGRSAGHQRKRKGGKR